MDCTEDERVWRRRAERLRDDLDAVCGNGNVDGFRVSLGARGVLHDLLGMAGCCLMGDYHRDGLFRSIADAIRKSGRTAGRAPDTTALPDAHGYRESIRNMEVDVGDLYGRAGVDTDEWKVLMQVHRMVLALRMADHVWYDDSRDSLLALVVGSVARPVRKRVVREGEPGEGEDMTDVGDIVEAWLSEHGYGGLVNPDGGCGCPVGNLWCCACPSTSCQPAYEYRCGECDRADDCEERDISYGSEAYTFYSTMPDLCEAAHREGGL